MLPTPKASAAVGVGASSMAYESNYVGTPRAETPDHERKSGDASANLSPDAAETPTWLREAGGLAANGAVAAEQAEAEAEAEKARREAELEAQRFALQAKQEELEQAQGVQQVTASTASELREQCESLKTERCQLLKEKGELLAQIAKQAGHLNHKQKIHYVAKLKEENDDLKRQLKEAIEGRAASSKSTISKPVTSKPVTKPLVGSNNGKENGRPAAASATARR